MDSVIREFNENGFSILSGVLALATLEAVKRECEALVAALAVQRHTVGKLPHTSPDAPFETRLIRLYENHPDENPTLFRAELHREGFFAYLHIQPYWHSRVSSSALSSGCTPTTPFGQNYRRINARRCYGTKMPAILQTKQMPCG